METNTRTEDNSQNLTDLECELVEIQAVDRYKRLLKAAKEIRKAWASNEKDGALAFESEENLTEYRRQELWDKYSNLIITKEQSICEKYDIPKVLFTDSECGQSTCLLPSCTLEFIRPWIRAAAKGTLTDHQLDHLIGFCCEDNYFDPYWVILGEPFFYMHWEEHEKDDRRSDELKNLLKKMATRNSHKAKRMRDFGYTGWGCGEWVLSDAFEHHIAIDKQRISEMEEEGEFEKIKTYKKTSGDFFLQKFGKDPHDKKRKPSELAPIEKGVGMAIL